MKNILFILITSILIIGCNDISNNTIEDDFQIEFDRIIVMSNSYQRICSFSSEAPNLIYAFHSEKDFSSHIIDTINNIIIGDIYFFDNGEDYFKEGLTRFERNDKIGFLNKKGDIIVEPNYDFASYFIDGYAKVGLDCENYLDTLFEQSMTNCKSYGVIDKLGNLTLPIIYNDITAPTDSNSIVKIDDFKINLNAFTDSLNLLKLPYGTFFGVNGVLKVYPMTETNQFYYEFENESRRKTSGILYKKKGKQYYYFNNDNSVLDINSVTPGLYDTNIDNYLIGTWGTYYKDKLNLK